MAPGRDNGDRSALAMFAAGLRAARTRAGLSRDELAARINYSGSLVGLAENMIRVPTLPGVVAVRDSKDPSGPALVFPRDEWAAFTAALKD